MPTRDLAPTGAPCWFDLMTSDTEKARRFYGELFGWTSEEPNEEFGGYLNFSKDGVMVAGCMANDGSSGMPDVWSIYLASEDAQATADAAVANGGSVIVAPMAIAELGTMAVLVDAGGAAIGVWQSGLHKGFGVLGEPGTPNWFELHTRDYAASVAFYETVFGWDAHGAMDTDDFHYTTLGEGDGQLAGIMDAAAFLPEGVPPHWSVYIQVAHADQTVARIAELGGSLITGPDDTPYGRMATVADPTGAVFKINQPPS